MTGERPSARSGAILARFPAYLGAAEPGKRIAVLVDALAGGLDVLTCQVGDVRTAHRVRQAPTDTDLLALTALHGLGRAALGPLDARLVAIAAATDPAVLADLTGLPATTLAALGADLPAVVARGTRAARRLAARRAVLLGAVDAQARGAATPPGLLRATAAYLGLEVEEITATPDRWWHLARCRDTVRLVVATPGTPEGADLTPAVDLVALEENPVRVADRAPAARRDGERFEVLRGGMGEVPVAVRVRGTGARTVRPMVVRLDRDPPGRPGEPPPVRGMVFEGSVPDGTELVFTAAGQVRLGGADVTGSAWSFTGAVFASALATLPGHDVVFGGPGTPPDAPVATFARTAPVPDAFGAAAVLPHGAPSVGPVRMPVGRSRWAAFVRPARTAAPPDVALVPRTAAGRFDASVFGAEPPPPQLPSVGERLSGGPPARPPVAPAFDIGFAWEEREPFAVRVVLPRRLRGLDPDPDGAPAATGLRGQLGRLLDRHRAAGVELRVEFADPRWRLGTGVLAADGDPIAATLAGTELWPDGTAQPDRRRP